MRETLIHLFDDYSLDLARGCLTRAHTPVHLRRQTYEVLKYLVEKRGHLISKDELIEQVWQGRAVTDGSLGKCIEEVREALGEKARKYVRTERGRGYIFDADADELQSAASSSREDQIEVLTVTLEDGAEIPDLHPTSITTRAFPASVSVYRSKATILTAASVFILAIVGIVVAYQMFANRDLGSAPITSIAVLPFKNESGNPEVEYLSDGMTESLINSVSQLPQVSVKARSTVFRYKGKSLDPQRIASELSVQAILEGRLVQHGDDLILYLSLIDGKTATNFGAGNTIEN